VTQPQPCTSVVLLIVGPDMTLVARRARLFRQIGYCVVVARSGDHAVRLALDSGCDMVLICHRFGDVERESIRFIQYLDPDIQEVKQTIWRHHDFDGLVTLVLLLGGVIVCFAVLFIHIAE